ncbi:MAG: elongation factor G [Thermotogota bacterium]|nr:elongation factor G [Thermotogota bacterium]
MENIPVEEKRNVVFIGHHGCGKTHLIDSLLLTENLVEKSGVRLTDSEKIEKERSASFSLGVTGLTKKGKKINIIDTPGMSDFHAAVSNGIFASENAVIVINSTAGMEVQAGRFGTIAKDMGKGLIVFFNMFDKERAEYEETLDEIQTAFERSPVLLQLPIGKAESFKGIVDLIDKKAYIYDGASGNYNVEEIPEDISDQVEEARTKMIEDIIENEEELMEKYFEGEEITQDELRNTLRKAYIDNQIIPIAFGSAAKNIGADPLLDVLINFGKTPSEADELDAELSSGEKIKVKFAEEEPFVGYVFKAIVDPFVGKLTFVKVVSGSISQGETFLVVNEDSTEKASHIQITTGGEDEEIKEASVGDIIKFAKLKKSKVTDTLAHKDRPLRVVSPVMPEPMLSRSIQAKTKSDIDKISNGLSRLSESDPTFTWEHDAETAETVISGLGGIHLDVMVERLKKLFSVDVEVGKPKIAYRETLKKKVTTEYKHKKQTGGHGQYGHVQMEIEPLERGEGFEFVDKIVGGVIPKNYIPAVEKGVKEAMKNGVVAGYPVVDVRVTLVYGSYHDVDSSDMSFQVAAVHAFKDGMKKADPVILEPIMEAEIFVPDDSAGDIMGEVTSRRGRPLGMEPQGKGLSKISAHVPLSEMLDFSSKLNSLTSGRGYFTMKFSGYQETPSDVQEKIIVEREREEENK